jgi:drug/metabolite transporter (DMT)-like permease
VRQWALLTLVALIGARVVIVLPIVATTPLFSLVISLIFLRGKEQVTGATVFGTVAIVAGTVAVAWKSSDGLDGVKL